MNYRELQQTLKPLKAEGLTDIKLNSCKKVLQVEYSRLMETSQHGYEDDSQSKHLWNSLNDSSSYCVPLATTPRVFQDPVKELELDTEIAARVAESWTDNPEQAIATAAAYSVAGFAMVVLWIALIATTLAIAGLKCWHWCRSRYSDLALQLTYFDPSFEFPAFAKPPLTSLIPVRPLHVH